MQISPNATAARVLTRDAYELREHASGCNAGRWDYIFSMIKKLRSKKELVLPDRAQITMTVPFMRAYTELLIKTCHRRGAHAIGGMAPFIPSRKSPEINEAALARGLVPGELIDFLTLPAYALLD